VKTIVLLRPAPTTALKDIQAALIDEERALWRSHVAGEVREALYDLSLPGAIVLVLETAEAAAARATIEALPLVRRGLLEPQIIHTRPYDGFANLFATEHGFAQALPAEWR
jgi:hypothetical protein